jgi:hypothetical protein
VFASKKVNCGGLQIADLIARPIGRSVLNPAQKNRAYDLIERTATADVSPGRA